MNTCYIDPLANQYKCVIKMVKIRNDWFLVLAETSTQFLVALKGENKYFNKNSFEHIREV